MSTANGTSSSNEIIQDTPVYYGAGDVENKPSAKYLERMVTPGGHPVDFSQPAIPVQHRKFGNPLPVGLFSFSMGFWVAGLYTLQARGVTKPNLVLPMFTMFLGITQTLTGWFEMFIGNTFSASIFICYGGFCLSYAMIFLPAFGVVDAYMVDGVLSDEFNQAMGLFLIMWAVISFLFILAALRSSVAILSTLFFVMMSFILMACQSMTGTNGARIGAGVMNICAGTFGFWAALSGYWTPDVTYAFIRAPPIDLSKRD